MSERVCLRCDWLGEADEDACPRCAAPLYVVGGSGSALEPVAPPEETTDETPADLPPGDPGSAIPAAAGRRWFPIALGVLVAAGIAGGLFLIGAFDAPQDVVAAAPTTSPSPSRTAAAVPTPIDERPPAPGECPVVGPAVGSPGAPSGNEASFSLPPTDAIAAALVADYRFQGSFATSVGAAPSLEVLCEGSVAFVDETVFDDPRTVLRFVEGGGLSVDSPSIPDPESFSIEVVLRFDDVSGYRKIVDLSGGSSDAGLYVLGRSLVFYPYDRSASRAIDADVFVDVVMTRDTSGRVVGYVDGIPRFSVRDRSREATLRSEDDLRFLIDDPGTASEQSAGSVGRIRIFERPLTAAEVLQLACDEGANRSCG